jgi:glycosyltransferase involved in cell wall biosynthesis
MQEARIALVPERHGGGFKLKVLDYVFNRLPILALEGSVAGVPLQHDDGILFYGDHRALAAGVLQVIDDYERLNRLQDRAYTLCRDRFDWASRAGRLLGAMAAS